MDRSRFFSDNGANSPRQKADIVRIGGSGKELLPHLTLKDLPPPGTTRWVMRRKAEVVAAVRNNLLSLEEACERYTLSVEEFLSWQELIDRHGVRALRATRVKDYRTSASKGERPAHPPQGFHPSRTG